MTEINDQPILRHIMKRLKNFSAEHKKEFVIFGAFIIILILIELFLFNRGFVISHLSNLEERHYFITDGTLYHFNNVSGKLVAQDNDPNITFNNINIPVGTISIKCNNSVPGAVGQVFYRTSNESFSEAHSIFYNASLPDNTLSLDQAFGLPKAVIVYSLRFDLTDTPGDKISCDEIVINPHIPLNVSGVRFVIYTGLSLIALLFLFHNIKQVINQKVVFVFIFLIAAFILGLKLMPLAVSLNIVFIVVLCILLFCGGATYALIFINRDSRLMEDAEKGFLQRFKYEISIAFVLMITTLPLLTESYFYYDDWWNIGNSTFLTKQNLFALGRPIQFLIVAVFDKINIRNAYEIKWAFLLAIILYAIVLYRWLIAKTLKKNFSFLFAIILSLFAPVMDLLGYTATGAFTFSLLFSSLSVVCFEQAYTSFEQKDTRKLIFNISLTFILIFVACLAYQIGPQIVFLFFTIELYFGLNQKSILKKNFAYLVLFALSNGFYLIFIKLINQLYGAELTTDRSQIINSIPQVIDKLQFYENVLKQSIMQVEIALTGNEFILERYHGYSVSFSNSLVGNLIFYFIISLIIIAFVGYIYRSKSFFGLLTLLIYIPFSYYTFLILSENGYLTYYAFAHISILMFYFLMGFITLIKFMWGKIKKTHYFNESITKSGHNLEKILIPFVVLCFLISNNYIRDFYINYNSLIYDFVKYNIQTSLESNNLRRIHITGSISPINADVYSGFVVDTALKDLGRNPEDYVITFSKSTNFMARIEEVEYLKILNDLFGSDKQVFEDYYTFDPKYRIYNINVSPTEQDQITLHRIFVSSGIIPETSSPDTLLINLTWTDQAYYNH